MSRLTLYIDGIKQELIEATECFSVTVALRDGTTVHYTIDEDGLRTEVHDEHETPILAESYMFHEDIVDGLLVDAADEDDDDLSNHVRLGAAEPADFDAIDDDDDFAFDTYDEFDEDEEDEEDDEVLGPDLVEAVARERSLTLWDPDEDVEDVEAD